MHRIGMLILIVCFVWGCKSDDPTRPEMTVGSLSGLVVDSKDPLPGLKARSGEGMRVRAASQVTFPSAHAYETPSTVISIEPEVTVSSRLEINT